MHEATRRAYLALLGIEQWVPRDAVDALTVVDAVVDAGTVVSVGSVVGPASGGQVLERSAAAEPTTEPASVSASLSPERAAQLDAMLAQSRRQPGTPARGADAEGPASAGQGIGRPAEAGTSAIPATTATTIPVAAVASSPERIGCSFLPLGDGLLIVAAFVAPQAPGLSGPEHALLANIAAALAPGSMLPATIDFSWPPAGLRVPGMDKPGVGREALVAMLAEQRKRGARDVVVLGDEMVALLGDAVTRLAMAQAGGPSLAVMLADPLAKRACWAAVRSLRRATPA